MTTPGRLNASATPDVPQAAALLGGLGVIPFVATVGALFIGEAVDFGWAMTALAAYGAVILSFLGGIHWGLAIGQVPVGESVSYRQLVFSVVPSLVGWLSLLLPVAAGLPLLGMAFVLMLCADWWASRRALTPSWYPKLRWPLTLAAVSSLALGSFA